MFTRCKDPLRGSIIWGIFGHGTYGRTLGHTDEHFTTVRDVPVVGLLQANQRVPRDETPYKHTSGYV